MTSALTEHDAFMALLATLPNTIGVYDSGAPDGAHTPYVVVWDSLGMTRAEKLSAESSQRTCEPRTICVGENTAQVRLIAQKVEAAVLDRRPDVAQRNSGPVTRAESQPVTPDRSEYPKRTLYTVADVWQFTTHPK